MILKKNICFILLFILIASPLLAINAVAEDTNLALKKSYTITYESRIDNAFPKVVHDDSLQKLTDGKKAEPVANDSNWLRLYRGTSITVTIDLGKVCAVNSVNLGQLNISGAGICCSRYVYASVSEDGEKYGTVGSKLDEKSVTYTSISKINHNISFGEYYKARYVRLKFSCDVWTYNDEIEVFGSDDSGLGNSATIDTEVAYPNAFSSDIDGLRNIVLMYSSKYYKGAASDVGMNTREELLPYFTYVDSSFKPKDKMFDGMLFLPLTPTTKESTGNEEYAFTKKTGWEMYLESVIGKGDTNFNIAALNDIVGENKTQLGLADDYKYPIYISVPFIEISNTIAFGEIDGELVVPSSLENRVKIVEWFVDSIISSFKKANFKNIQLNGMYWQNELVNYKISEYEDDLIQAYNAYVHQKDYSSIWIPYYCAPGSETWKELGFDAAVLQSNYAFIEQEKKSQTGPKKPGTVDDSLSMAKKYGLGMEFETSSRLTSGDTEAYDRLYQYVISSYFSGLMDNGLTMYYQGGGPGTLYTCARATSGSKIRNAYELMYKYISGTFTSFAPVVKDNQVIIVKKGESCNGHISVTDQDTASGVLKGTITENSKNVSVKIDNDFIILDTIEDFIGEDTFKLKFNDGYSDSNETTVKIYVVEDLITVRNINGTLKNDTVTVYNKAGKQTETDSTAFEVVVGADGKIVSVGGNNNTVPDGGYVISASGSAQTYLKDHAKENLDVIYDTITDSIVFSGVKGSSDNVSNDEPAKDDAAKDDADYLSWIIISACVLIIIGVGVFVVIKIKNTKGEVH